MANPTTRPVLRSPTERRTTRRAKSPATATATDEVENSTRHHLHRHHNHHQRQHHHGSTPHNASNTINAVLTRRSSKSAPLLALNDEKPAQQVTDLSALGPAPRPASSRSKKRPATIALASPDTTADSTRPPTKVTVTQPHGELLRITNGVAASLGIGEDEVPSGLSTPKSNGAAPRLTLPVPPAALAGAQAPQDKRSLRSHDGGSRLKSDLSIYFANYDDIIADVPKAPELLEPDTPIYIIDEPLKAAASAKPPTVTSPKPSRKSLSPSRSRKSRQQSPSRRISLASIPTSLSSTAYQVLDYSTVAKHARHADDEDPFADSVYFAQHRRAERKEKQLRNIEKERAMHEKVQLERLLDGLQGPDWLKVMGITGVTDGDRKDWEPKRDYFVKEVEALVDKFRRWKEEEKRQRVEKEAALAARDDGDEEEESSEADANVSGAEPSASEQKEQEPRIPKPRRPPRPHGFLLPVLPPEPQGPFVSFYAKPHLRAAALGQHRHGRNHTAFGRPIPDFEQREFELPSEYTTMEALRDHARKRRRQKRESSVQKK
ncbi:hypothetical protein CC78DRAFT_539241 [Lojkania enalia]|uniref:Something about silencing protein 4 domain-containing protein n=1 Tax=Lojkania enalia TaxID=147567 RepID=A0A9P4NCJ1_9PLEO|nr:hypothetical protein CC78DRAFT_539241 [Didymosphaeria enalia]